MKRSIKGCVHIQANQLCDGQPQNEREVLIRKTPTTDLKEFRLPGSWLDYTTTTDSIQTSLAGERKFKSIWNDSART